MFYSIQCIIYCYYILLDFGVLASNVNTSYSKYLSILLCTCYVFFMTKQAIVRWIMVCLCIADYCLLFTNFYTAGIFVFCIIQCGYMQLLKKNDNVWYYALLYACICMLVFIKLPILYRVSFVYASYSIYNLYHVWKQNEYTLAMTILLLAICDIFVALSYFMYGLSHYIWIFYLPSQWFFITYCKHINKK